MQPVSASFGFLKRHGEPLFTLAALAEHYFRTDPNTCLYKLRQFGELMARGIAARAGLLNDREQTQAALIGAIGRGGYATPQVVELFHFLRGDGNEAVHEGGEEFAIALNALKIARQLSEPAQRSCP